MRAVALCCALLCLSAAALDIDRAHIKSQRHRLRSKVLQRERAAEWVEAAIVSEVGAEADAEADSDSAAMVLADTDATAEAEAESAAAAAAAVREELAANSAAEQARGEREAAEQWRFQQLHGQSHSQSVQSVGHPYAAAVHDVVCAHMNAWITNNHGGLAAPNLAHPNVLASWQLAFTAVGAGHADRTLGGLHPAVIDAVGHPAGAEIIRTVRFRHARFRRLGAAAGPGDAVCLAAAIETGVNAHRAVGLAAWKNAAYTIGVEWELHFARITPHTDGIVTMAQSGALGGGGANAAVPWVRWTTDHRMNLQVPATLDTIVEVNIGPLALSPGAFGAGSATHATAARVAAIVAHSKAGIVAVSRAANAAPTATVNHCYGTDTMANTLADINGRCANVISAGGHELDLAETVAAHWSVQACRYDSTTDAAMRGDQYVQANYAMPLSGTASKHWLDGHGGKGTFWDDARYKIARYSRRAAVNYVTDATAFPAAELAALSDEQKADVLGLFHVYLHQLCAAVYATRAQRAALDVPNTPKNLFGHLLKTNVGEIVKKLSPETADFIHHWYAAQNFGAGPVATNAPLNRLVNALRDELYGSGGQIETQARWMLDDAGRRAVILQHVRDQLRAFGANADACCHGRIPPVGPLVTAADQTCCTSPIGFRAPSAIRTGGGAVDGVLSVVVESRYGDNALTAAVVANNPSQIDAALTGFLHQHTWNGVKNKFFADHTV